MNALPKETETPAAAPSEDVFDDVWREIAATEGAARFPDRIFWLNGAPGAGKGTHTPAILRHLKLETPPIVVSDLIKSPAAQKLIDAGLLVGDREVLTLLLAKLRDPQYANGVLVDGFPRTAAQVGFLRQFHTRLSRHNASQALPPPHFATLVLLVDEKESVARQMKRGREAKASGGEIRKTDLDPGLAACRYRVFAEQTLAPLQTLRDTFPYHLIEPYGTIEEVSARILAAL
ncbi:MAG: nucleoside monophosphate kinase [Puniceicoccales bacterium]|jgi:adenylate kinase|nr:nucleoside monophosphate kinase [Puniceicoccales bacterium]